MVRTKNNIRAIIDTKAILNKFRQEIIDHVGKYAILIEKGGKHSFSFFIQITGRCTGKYKCYDFEGNFRCFVNKYLDAVQLLIGEQQLIYLDEGGE